MISTPIASDDEQDQKSAESLPDHGGIHRTLSSQSRIARMRPLAYPEPMMQHQLVARGTSGTACNERTGHALAGACRARRSRGWHLHLWRDVDRRLLPAQLPEPAAARGSRPLLRYDRRGTAGRISRLQALPAGHGRPRPAGHRCRAPRLGVSRHPRRSDRDARSSRARRVDEPASSAAPLQGDRRVCRPREFQSAVRAGKLRTSLRDGRDVTTAIYEAGYGSPSRVYEAAPTGKGMSLSNYRRGGAGMRIGYSTMSSPVGLVLVAATENGVCSVKIGEQRDRARRRSAARVSRRRDRSRTKAAQRVGQGDRQAPSRRCAVARSADRCPGHGVSVEGVARAAADSVRRDPRVCRGREEHRQAQGGPRRRPRLRHQSGLPRRPLPPGRPDGRRRRRVRWGTGRKEKLLGRTRRKVRNGIR